METDKERFQSFRRGREVAGQDSRVVSIEAFYHPNSGKHVVYWVDIQDAFPHIDNIVIMKEARIVSRARDTSGLLIEPRCIMYHHNVALEVVNDVFLTEVGSNLSPPSSILRSTTLDPHMDRDLNFIHTRMASTASSHLTVDNAHPSQAESALPVSLGDPSDLMSPHTSNDSSGNNKEQGMISNDLDNQQTLGLPQWTTYNAERSHSERKVAVSTSSQSSSCTHSSQSNNALCPNNGRVLEIEDDMDMLNLSTSRSHSTARDSSTQSRQFMQRMESAVQSFGHLMVKGQHDQTLLVKKESESIKQEVSQYYESLKAEVAKNTTLQNQLKEMMVAEQRMTKRILDLQEAQLDSDKMMLILQQQALDRLALIHSKATAILTQTYELHEFPIPRLFIILPKEDITKREKISTLFVQRFRLYFLCECGEHTRPVDGPPSSLSHEIHLARHEGYDLDRPNEFFRKYGSYVLALLQMLKYGVAAAGMVVPPLNNLKVADGLEYVEEGLKAIEKGLAPRVDSAIEYLQGLTASQDGVSKDLGDASSTSTLVDPVSISRLEGLEGADLRHLGSFLKARDESKVLGNLYRTVTPKGHVKWVCLDHYRESYGAAALQEFKETVELNGGTYDQRTGRVTMRLASPILARQFYTMLLSTRLVYELELTLDWNTAFEDLRTLKGVVQQSNVFHLSLDLRGKTGPTSDFVYRNRRAEPIIQIMASGKVHTMTLKNTTGFLFQTKELLKTTLHVRHFDLGEIVGTTDDFIKLENLIRASPTLLRLGVVVGDIDGAFARLKPLVARHKALSTLDLALRDGTAVSVRFEQGSDKIGTIGLRIVEPNVIKLMQMPMVISVAFLAKYTAFRASDLVQMAIRDHRHLKVVEIVQLPDGTAEKLQDLQRAIDLYSPEVAIQEGLEDKEFFAEETTTTTIAVTGAESVMTGSRFTELDLRHRRSLLWDLVLLVASVDETREISEETPEETPTDALVASSVETHKRRSIFTLHRQDTSLASVRYEVSEDGANSAVLHVNDFDASEACQQMSATGLALFGGAGFELFRELTKDSTTDLSSVRTLEFGCMPEDLLDVLTYVQQVAPQYPALSRLNLWDFNDKTMRGFDLPLRDLNLLDQSLSVEQLPSLQTLLHATPTLSRMLLSTHSISKTFETVKSTAKLHKGLSSALLVTQTSRLLVQFAIGSGAVQSIALRTKGSELELLSTLSEVTNLNLLSSLDLSHITELAISVFTNYRQLETTQMEDVAVVTTDTIRRDLRRFFLGGFTGATKSGSDPTNTAPAGVELALFSVFNNDNGFKDDGMADIERVSSIIRIRRDGEDVLEAVALDWTDADGVTLRLNSMAFDESDFARFADVTRMEVSLGRHFTMVDNLIRTPVKTFSDLKRLDLSCGELLPSSVLWAALEAVGGHLALAQLRIRSPQSTSDEITSHLPLKTLDLTPYSFLPRENVVLERILASGLIFSHIRLNVSELLTALTFVCSNFKKLGSLSQLQLYDRVGSILSISLKPEKASEMKSAILTSVDLQGKALDEDRLLVAMLHLSEATLEFLGAIQEATVDNPGFHNLGFMRRRGNTMFTLGVPFRKSGQGQQLLSLEQFRLLRQLPSMLTLLSELQLTLASVLNLNKAIRILGSVFRMSKRSPILRLVLPNGNEASVLFSKDGAVQSVGLRILEEYLEELGTILKVKEVTICPKDATLWRDAEYAKEGLAKVLDLYPETVTVQLDCVVDDPCPILLFFHDKQQASQWLQLRCFRYRETESSHDVTTHIIRD